MSYKDEFLKQWDDLYAAVESEILRQIKNDGQVNLDVVNKVLKTYSNKWLNSFHSQGRWLSELKKLNPEIGDEFEANLNNLHISEAKLNAGSSLLIPIIISFLSGIAGYWIANIFNFAQWQVIGTTLILPIVVFIGLFSYWRYNNVEMMKKSRSNYMDQLNDTKAALVQICEKADTSLNEHHD